MWPRKELVVARWAKERGQMEAIMAWLRRYARAHVYDPGTASEWRQAVVDAAQPHVIVHGALQGPVQMNLVFWMQRPLGHWGTGRNKGRLRNSAPKRYHLGIPDRTNLIRGVEDALTDSGIWNDDRQVVDGRAVKMWEDVQTRFVGVAVELLAPEHERLKRVSRSGTVRA